MTLQKQMNLRKGIVLLLICLLAFSAPVSAMAAQVSEAASTVRLEKTEGTVTVENNSGKAISVVNALRLYSGYEVATKAASYAWISLDSSKAIKLDSATDARVMKAGKKLEMQVVSGKMFFNVTKPLESNESMTIRTSTMVTGVRGTSGWVEVIDRSTVRISLLDGTLEVYSINPVTGERRSITITGGQTLTIVYHGEDGSSVSNQASSITTEENAIKSLIQSSVIREEHIVHNDIGLTVETLQEEDVPGFVAVEVAKDSALQQKIEKTTKLSVPLIINNADERLKAKEAADEAKSKELQKQANALRAEAVDPLFGTTAENSSGSSSTGGSTGDNNTGGDNTGGDNTEGGTEEEPPVVEDEIVEADVTLNNPTTSEVQEALDGNTVVEVTNATITNLNVAANDGLTVPEGKTLRLTSGSMQVSDGTLTINGTMNINSTGDGSTTSGLAVDYNGKVNINSKDSLHIKGTLENNGYINVGDTADGALTVEQGGTLTNNGYINVNSGDSIFYGLTVAGSLINDYEIYVGKNAAGSMEITSNGALINDGNLNISDNNFVGIMQSSGTIQSSEGDSGSISVSSGGVMDISGDISEQRLDNYGIITLNKGANLSKTIETTDGEGCIGISNWPGGTLNIESGAKVSAIGTGVKAYGVNNYGEVIVNGGEITVTSDAGEAYGIYNLNSSGSFTPSCKLTQGAKVSATTTAVDGTASGIQNIGSLVTIDGSDSVVTVTGTAANGIAYGIYSEYVVNVNDKVMELIGGNITASGGTGSSGIYSKAGLMNVSGGSVQGPTAIMLDPNSSITLNIGGDAQITGTVSYAVNIIEDEYEEITTSFTMTGGTLYASERDLLCSGDFPGNGSVGVNADATMYCYFVGDTPPEGFKRSTE